MSFHGDRLDFPAAVGRRALPCSRAGFGEGAPPWGCPDREAGRVRTAGRPPSASSRDIGRACLLSAEAYPQSETLHVGSDALDNALEELMDTRIVMTRVLRGASAVQ